MTSPFVYFSLGKNTLSRFETFRILPPPRSRLALPRAFSISPSWASNESLSYFALVLRARLVAATAGRSDRGLARAATGREEATTPFPLDLWTLGFSTSTSRASLSSRTPRKIGWRRRRSAVHSLNLTSTTTLGSTQCAFSFVFGVSANGDVFLASGLSRPYMSLSESRENPPP